jgi:hypothetical protein
MKNWEFMKITPKKKKSRPYRDCPLTYIIFNMLLHGCRSVTKVSSHSLLTARAGRLSRTTSLYRSSFQVMQMSNKVEGNSVIYTGPLATVAKRLKLFSISSLGLSGAISPFVFILDFPVPVVAKTVLVASGKAYTNDKYPFSFAHNVN